MADTLKIYGAGLLVALAAFFVAYQFVQPAPPNSLTIATGRSDGAYFAYATRYAQELAKEGITLNIKETRGSIENVSLLADDNKDVQVAFVQSGVTNAADFPELHGLGSLYFEPLWVFVRTGSGIVKINQLVDKRVAIGAQGSGTRAVAKRILADNELLGNGIDTVALGGTDAINAFAQGDIDVVFTVGSYESLSVQTLLRNPDAQLLSFKRADAYARRHPYLSNLYLPEGIVDFKNNIPSANIKLIAPAATLIARKDLHPALSDLLLQVSTRVFGNQSMFSISGQFPSPDFLDVPVSDEANRYYKSGTPFLLRYLPFWAATMVDRLKVMILPLLALLIPLARILPPTYRWSVRKKIYKWYDEIQLIDQSADENPTEANLEVCLANLDKIEDEVREVEVPLGYAHELYVLRQHIDFLARQISIQESKLESIRLASSS